MPQLHYNQIAGSIDGRTGGGYGKGQKTPSFGTGLGSMSSMGSSESGIYVDPYEGKYADEDIEEEDFDFDDSVEIDKFVKKIAKKYTKADPTFWPRADRSSLGSSSNRFDLGLGESSVNEKSLPGVRSGMAPFSSKTLYPNGFSGPPLGSGGANQAFRTTGNYRRTGTQYGTSRAPISTDDDQEFKSFSLSYILNLDKDERNLARHNIKVLKVINRLQEIDKEYDFSNPVA